MIDRYQIPATFNACALALERNPPLCAWLRERDHDVLGHGYHWYGPDAGPDKSLTRGQERAEIAHGGRVDPADDRPAGPGLDGPLIPDREHQGTARRGGRLPVMTPTPTTTRCRTG